MKTERSVLMGKTFGNFIQQDLLTGHGRVRVGARCTLVNLHRLLLGPVLCRILGQNTYIQYKCLLNTCHLMESREWAGGFLPTSPQKKRISNSPHLTKLAEKEEAGVCPIAEAVFLAREDIVLGLQIHLTDLLQYVLLSRGEEIRSWDESQKWCNDKTSSDTSLLWLNGSDQKGNLKVKEQFLFYHILMAETWLTHSQLPLFSCICWVCILCVPGTVDLWSWALFRGERH